MVTRLKYVLNRLIVSTCLNNIHETHAIFTIAWILNYDITKNKKSGEEKIKIMGKYIINKW